MMILMNIFRRWKSKGKMYSFRCFQKAKSLDSTIDYEKVCCKCGNRGVIYRKEMCYSCYFGFEKNKEALQ